MAGVGIVIGPTLGGLLLAHFSWARVFWLNVPLVAVALVAVCAIDPAPRAGHHEPRSTRSAPCSPRSP